MRSFVLSTSINKFRESSLFMSISYEKGWILNMIGIFTFTITFKNDLALVFIEREKFGNT